MGPTHYAFYVTGLVKGRVVGLIVAAKTRVGARRIARSWFKDISIKTVVSVGSGHAWLVYPVVRDL